MHVLVHLHLRPCMCAGIIFVLQITPVCEETDLILNTRCNFQTTIQFQQEL